MIKIGKKKLQWNIHTAMSRLINMGLVPQANIQHLLYSMMRKQAKAYVKQLKKEGRNIDTEHLISELKRVMGVEGLNLWKEMGNDEVLLAELSKDVIAEVCGEIKQGDAKIQPYQKQDA